MKKHDSPRIMYVQKADFIDAQKPHIEQFLSERIPSAKILYASKPEDVELGQEVDILITPTIDFLDSLIQRLEGLSWIHFMSAGVEKIWSMNFDKSAYLLSKSAGVHGASMSEFAIGAMLYFEKSFHRFVEQSRHREWKRFWLGELEGKQLTILGVGHIGQSIAQKASQFGMKVVGAVNTKREIKYVDHVVDLEEVKVYLPSSDYIVVCLPLTDPTHHYVDNEFVNQLKRGSVLVDISRGGVVSEDAILYGLKHEILRGVSLDVFEVQPLHQDSELWDNPKVLLTPHVSGTSQNYLCKALEIFWQNYASLNSAGKLITPVSTRLKY